MSLWFERTFCLVLEEKTFIVDAYNFPSDQNNSNDNNNKNDQPGSKLLSGRMESGGDIWERSRRRVVARQERSQ